MRRDKAKGSDRAQLLYIYHGKPANRVSGHMLHILSIFAAMARCLIAGTFLHNK
jgi:hypothetical protein